jgi:hypothetical protein
MSSKKSKPGSSKHYFKKYRQSEFTDETEYYQLVDGKKVPMSTEDAEWLRKFQLSELSAQLPSDMDPALRSKKYANLHSKRFDVMNAQVIPIDQERLDNINTVESSIPETTPDRNAFLDAIEKRDRTELCRLLNKHAAVLDVDSILRLYDRKTRPKQRYQSSIRPLVANKKKRTP